MNIWKIEGKYDQNSETETFQGELGEDQGIIKGHLDEDIGQYTILNPENQYHRSNVVEGHYRPENNTVYLINRDFAEALKNVEADQGQKVNTQEIHILAQTPEKGIQGSYQGIWTQNSPGELPLEQLSNTEFELGWNLDTNQYESQDNNAEEIIQDHYRGQNSEEDEEINGEAARGTIEFEIQALEVDREERQELPMDAINIALDGGVDRDRRIT